MKTPRNPENSPEKSLEDFTFAELKELGALSDEQIAEVEALMGSSTDEAPESTDTHEETEYYDHTGTLEGAMREDHPTKEFDTEKEGNKLGSVVEEGILTTPDDPGSMPESVQADYDQPAIKLDPDHPEYIADEPENEVQVEASEEAYTAENFAEAEPAGESTDDIDTLETEADEVVTPMEEVAATPEPVAETVEDTITVEEDELEEPISFRKTKVGKAILGTGAALALIATGMALAGGDDDEAAVTTPGAEALPFDDEGNFQAPEEGVTTPTADLRPNIPAGYEEKFKDVVTEPVIMNAQTPEGLFKEFMQNSNCMFGKNPLETKLECYDLVFWEGYGGNLDDAMLESLFTVHQQYVDDSDFDLVYSGEVDTQNSRMHLPGGTETLYNATIRVSESDSVSGPFEAPRNLHFKGSILTLDSGEQVFAWRLTKAEWIRG